MPLDAFLTRTLYLRSALSTSVILFYPGYPLAEPKNHWWSSLKVFSLK